MLRSTLLLTLSEKLVNAIADLIDVPCPQFRKHGQGENGLTDIFRFIEGTAFTESIGIEGLHMNRDRIMDSGLNELRFEKFQKAVPLASICQADDILVIYMSSSRHGQRE